jgi:cytochrome c-type biogenesis protein CcmH/NrfG
MRIHLVQAGLRPEWTHIRRRTKRGVLSLQAQEIINTKDWNRLLAYGKTWAQDEPNNATAWYVIARAYGSKFYKLLEVSECFTR